jgi:hypothetical protein
MESLCGTYCPKERATPTEAAVKRCMRDMHRKEGVPTLCLQRLCPTTGALQPSGGSTGSRCMSVCICLLRYLFERVQFKMLVMAHS